MPGSTLLLMACGLLLASARETVDTVVILRSHMPSDGERARILDLALDVMLKLPYAHMIVSVDDSHLSPRDTWFVPLPNANVHRYTWADVSKNYPNVHWDTLFDNAAKHTSVYLPNGRNYHMEPIWLALEHAKNHVDISEDAKVWALEDDVMVCGNFSQIVNAYHDDKSDMLTGDKNEVKGWPHRLTGSPAFQQMFPLEHRRYSLEFVERFSMRLLKRINELSRDKGCTTVSEMFAPTVCQTEGFSHGLYKKEHLGDWRWQHGVQNKKRADFLCSREEGEVMNHPVKLFHPRLQHLSQ